jgi:hypothetical protein
MLSGFRFLNLKFLVTIIFGIMALVAFNLGQPGIQTDNAIAFNSWYDEASSRFLPNSELSDADLALRIQVTAKDPSLGETPSVWSFPNNSLREPDEREDTGRVLQLIRESNIFGFAPLKDPLNAKSALSISIKDGDQSFDTTVPYNITESNIQLKNLLKLLEVFSAKTPAADLEPARL